MAKLEPRTIVMVGPPGSGKGTQATRLAEYLGWRHVDVGELLREASRGNSEDAQTIRAVMQRGQMLKQSLVRPILEKALFEQAGGVVLDGYARQVEQVNILLDWVKQKKIAPLLTIQLVVPSQEIIERIKLRRYCVDCRHKTYLVTDADEALSCLRCGGHLGKRDDDTTQTVVSRLTTYAAETLPAIEHLKQKSDHLEIDGRGTIDEVSNLIIDEIKQYEA